MKRVVDIIRNLLSKHKYTLFDILCLLILLVFDITVIIGLVLVFLNVYSYYTIHSSFTTLDGFIFQNIKFCLCYFVFCFFILFLYIVLLDFFFKKHFKDILKRISWKTANNIICNILDFFITVFFVFILANKDILIDVALILNLNVENNPEPIIKMIYSFTFYMFFSILVLLKAIRKHKIKSIR